MRILLDTHYLLWWLGATPELSAQARDIISEPANLIFFSVASLWELRIKEEVGKIDLPDSFAEALARQSFEALPITVNHTEALRGLPLHHRDPFDRMLVAQAKTDRLTILTRDQAVARYDVDHLLL